MKNLQAKAVKLAILLCSLVYTGNVLCQHSLPILAAQDCVCHTIIPDNNLNSNSLSIGQVDNHYYVSLVQFDLGDIPAGAFITEAKLYLNCIYNIGIDELGVFELSGSWDESTVTYNNMPYSNGNRPNYSNSMNVGWVNIDVTQSIFDWYMGLAPNFGFQLKPTDFNSAETAMFYNREAGNNYAPYLIVEYSLPTEAPVITAEPGQEAGQVRVSWTQIDGAENYLIVYDEDGSPPWSPQSGSPNSGSAVGDVSSVVVSELVPGQRYYFSVAANNFAGLSPYSEVVSTTAQTSVVELQNAITHSASIGEGESDLYTITVPSGAGSLIVKTFNTNSDVLDLYLAVNRIPSLTDYDFISGGYSGNEQIGVYMNSAPSIQGGVYNILVSGYDGGFYEIRAFYSEVEYLYELKYDDGNPEYYNSGYTQGNGPAVYFDGFYLNNGEWVQLEQIQTPIHILQVKTRFNSPGSLLLRILEAGTINPPNPGLITSSTTINIGELETGTNYYWTHHSIADNWRPAEPFWVSCLLSNDANPSILLDDNGLGDHSYSYVNGEWSKVIDRNNYIRVVINSTAALTSISETLSIPDEFVVTIFPNPFNPSTTINYSMPEQSSVTITVFDIAGREITTLEQTEKPPGIYEVQWNGIDASGNPVSTGVYFARLQAGGNSKTIKMVYLR